MMLDRQTDRAMSCSDQGKAAPHTEQEARPEKPEAHTAAQSAAPDASQQPEAQPEPAPDRGVDAHEEHDEAW